MHRCVNIVDPEKFLNVSIWSQKSALLQPSRSKFADTYIIIYARSTAVINSALLTEQPALGGSAHGTVLVAAFGVPEAVQAFGAVHRIAGLDLPFANATKQRPGIGSILHGETYTVACEQQNIAMFPPQVEKQTPCGNCMLTAIQKKTYAHLRKTNLLD